MESGRRVLRRRARFGGRSRARLAYHLDEIASRPAFRPGPLDRLRLDLPLWRAREMTVSPERLLALGGGAYSEVRLLDRGQWSGDYAHLAQMAFTVGVMVSSATDATLWR